MDTKPQQSWWQGRRDSPHNALTQRWHDVVQILDWNTPPTNPSQAFGFLGFCSDEGVRRNLGRVGAHEGPLALRKALSNLAVHHDSATLFETGNIVCHDGHLEDAQKRLAAAVQKLLALNIIPIVLGGGHEVAYGHYLGISKFHPTTTRIGVINFDAHFDLRPYPNGSTSGSPFLQMSDLAKTQKRLFSYFCLGIQKSTNTQALFKTAEDLGVEFILAQDIVAARLESVKKQLDVFIGSVDVIYLTFCLDVFQAAIAPGVSAPTALGLTPEVVLPLFKHIVASGKVKSLDVAELAPALDQDNRTAKLAAQIIFEFVTR